MDRLNALPRPEKFAEARRRLDEARRRLVQDMSDEQAWREYQAALDAWLLLHSSGVAGRPGRGWVWSE